MWDLIFDFWPALKSLGLEDDEAADFIGEACGESYGNQVISRIKTSNAHATKRKAKAEGKSNKQAIEAVRKKHGDAAADGVEGHMEHSERQSNAYATFRKARQAGKENKATKARTAMADTTTINGK